MTKGENDFAKLLQNAPMAPGADTVTVTGTLARTADAAQFQLSLPDGRSVTLKVDAVKSAKTVAGAVGQALVQLELDAREVPEGVLHPVKAPYIDQTYPGRDHKAPILDHTALGTDYKYPYVDPSFKVIGDPQGGNTLVEGVGGIGGFGGDPGQFAPFVAAAPHQAHPATIQTLSSLAGPGAGFTGYLDIRTLPWNYYTHMGDVGHGPIYYM